MASQFITANAFSGLRLNVNNLVAYTYAFASSPTLRTALPYAPFLLNSQQAEHRFRTSRAMAGDANFTFAEFLRRSKLQEVHEVLKARHRGVFRYPEAEKAWNFDETPHTAAHLPAEFGVAALLAAARRERDDARACLRNCGAPPPVIISESGAGDLDDVDVDDEMYNIEMEPDEVRRLSNSVFSEF